MITKRSLFQPTLTTVISVLLAVVLFISATIESLNGSLAASNSSSVTRVKRRAPKKGFFFPIAMYSVKHHKPAMEGGRDIHPETWEYRGQYFYGYRPRTGSSRRRAARLLAAGLPLLLAPLLSIIFSFPVVVPITQMASSMTSNLIRPVIGKRRKKRGSESLDPMQAARLQEMQAVASYLKQVDYNERQQSRVMVNYLQCNGLLTTEDHCLERLSCEFSDPANRDAPELEKTVTSILLGHMLNNDFIPRPFKRRLKTAAVFGRSNSGSCNKFYCPYVDDNWDVTPFTPNAAPTTPMKPPHGHLTVG